MTDDAIAALKAARDAIDRALLLIEGKSDRAPQHQVDAEEWVTLSKAAGFRRCTDQTMQRLVIAHGLGVKAGGRWRVDLQRLRRWQANEPYGQLDPFAEG